MQIVKTATIIFTIIVAVFLYIYYNRIKEINNVLIVILYL